MPDNCNWLFSSCKRAAIFCYNLDTRKRCRLVASSVSWVGVEFGDMLLVSCYLSPNEGIIRFKEILKELGDLVRSNPDKILLCGDFNARSASWGCNTGDRRGVLFNEWVSELNLVILNYGNTPTCVRAAGLFCHGLVCLFIVDISAYRRLARPDGCRNLVRPHLCAIFASHRSGTL